MHTRIVIMIVLGVLMLSCAPHTSHVNGKTPVPSAQPTASADVAAPTSVDDLGRAVFSALQSEDESAFGHLIATEDDLAFIAATYEVSEQKARDAIMLRLFKSQERVMPSFHSVHGLAAAHGMDWKMAALERVEFELGTDDEGVTSTDAHLWLLARGERFRITLDDCVRLPRGWVLTDRMSWQGLQE